MRCSTFATAMLAGVLLAACGAAMAQTKPKFDLGKLEYESNCIGCHGRGGMISFIMKQGRGAAIRGVEHTKIFALAESLGGVESLIEVPAAMRRTCPSQDPRWRWTPAWSAYRWGSNTRTILWKISGRHWNMLNKKHAQVLKPSHVCSQPDNYLYFTKGEKCLKVPRKQGAGAFPSYVVID